MPLFHTMIIQSVDIPYDDIPFNTGLETAVGESSHCQTLEHLCIKVSWTANVYSYGRLFIRRRYVWFIRVLQHTYVQE